MTYFGLDWDRPIKEEYEINEYEDQTGAPWLEVFPYVFVEVDMNAQPVWERFELRNPEIEGMRLTALRMDGIVEGAEVGVSVRAGSHHLFDTVTGLRV